MPRGDAADLGQLITDAQVPGLSMAVIRNGGIESLTAAGVRNVRDGAPIDEQNHFRRGLLVQAGFCLRRVAIDRSGALALDTPLARHVPDDVLDDPRAGAIRYATF